MFDNNYNSNKINVNTTIITRYNDSKLTIGGWNDKISLEITPCSGKDENGMNIFNRDARINTALSPENAVVLYYRIKKKIIPLIEAGSDAEKSASVVTKSYESKTVIEVARVKENNDMVMKLNIYKAVGPDGKSTPSTQLLSYTFVNGEYMEDYDINAGTWEEGKFPGEFFMFYKILENSAFIMPITTHADRYSQAISNKLSEKYNQSPTRPSGDIPDGTFTNNYDGELPFTV